MSLDGSVYANSIKNFLQPIWHLLSDEKVTEVMINSFDEIWVEIAGRVQKTEAKFRDEDSLRAAVTGASSS